MRARIHALVAVLFFIFACGTAAFAQGAGVGTVSYTTGAFGQALTSLSDSNYVTFPTGTFPNGNTFSVDVRLKVPAGTYTGNPKVAVSNTGGSSTAIYWLGMNTSGRFVAGLPSGTGGFASGLDSGINIADGNWHDCLLVIVGGTTSYMFVDGVLGQTATGTFATLVPTTGVVGNFKPAASNFSFPGSVDELATFTTATHTATYTPPASAFTGTEPGLNSLYHFDGNLSSALSVTYQPNNANILYSPGNWSVTSSSATSINPGAYFSTMFTGNSITMNFDISNQNAQVGQLYYRVDGYDTQTPFTRFLLSSNTLTATVPSDMTAFPYHLLEVVIKSTNGAVNRWNAPSNTAVVLTSINLAGGSLLAPLPSPNGCALFYGDSITEGTRTVNSAAADADANDAKMGWAYAQRHLLGIEVGVIGFGGLGLTVPIVNVPALPSSWNYIMAGVPRVPPSCTKLIVINHGTNDQGSSDAAVTTALVTTLNGMLAAYPNVPIAVMRPFGGYKASALQAGIAQCNRPAMVTWIDTTGFYNTSYGGDSINYHPSGPNDLGFIGPKVANALRPLLYPTGKSYTFF